MTVTPIVSINLFFSLLDIYFDRHMIRSSNYQRSVIMSMIGCVMVSEDRLTSVAICGAGIAGLALAIRLTEMGYKPVVFEARSEAAASREGVFLTLAPNGANGLRAIGCYDVVKKNGVYTTGIEILNAKGKRLALADQSDHEREFGAPSITVRR